jgi:hypothetical protein
MTVNVTNEIVSLDSHGASSSLPKGDILVEYAVAGLTVLPFLFGPRWLALLAAAVGLVLFLTMPLLPPVVQFPSHLWIRDAYGVKVLGVQPVILDWCSNLLRFVLLTPLVLRNRDHALARMNGQWLLAVGVGVLSPLSYILVLIALEMQAPLSLVAPMREMSMLGRRPVRHGHLA